MISRRDFLRGSTALAVTPLVESILNHHEHFEEPLLIRPRTSTRVFYLYEDHTVGGFRIVTDALPFPRRLVNFDAIEREFGEGAFRTLCQRDHWRLIDQGRFSREETFQPAIGDGFFNAWAANYDPHSEAYNLLEDVGLGPDQDFGSGCGLVFFDTDEFHTNPGVCCVSTKAISLLQAELSQRNASIEVRFEQRTFDRICWKELLRNGGNTEEL
ncbi:twin-arginine translocation signal domain-containing protein [Pseudohalocynthiibacter sp. F2068]|uniref:twin-arginine translocation signal domain-containing protein n=1 Tax=Pseudohalocynthiibacter sp. F2068 TaxID=2926418 RepID=UPI001FF0F299|nr:twin-arginine translocation signal domain-containing protein [Pseudohalocynthiibacter sp. F2068]MCK0103647.1 twin-arginine translocation signal domain-containing protein [Pseudohalocynthiibacter sp. F2068]